MQKYPVGIQDFEVLRQENYLYIDKTEVIYQLITNGKYYFLSRPRRFGKSLLTSTLDAFFLGKKDLFEGLWISQQNDIQWKERPVIRLDFGLADFKDIGLEKAIQIRLQAIATHYQITLEMEHYAHQFKELIVKLSQDQKVVILIDEYDKPIIEYLDATELPQAQKNRAILKQFYSVIKSLDPHIHFFFLTGVSKFSKVSIFSDLNHLNDITMQLPYNTLVGYTQNELEHYFQKEIQQLAQQENTSVPDMIAQIKTWYNGYRWHKRGETVYNSFSILNLMSSRDFGNYWFETGTPTFLLKMLRDRQLYDMDKLEVTADQIRSYEIEHLDVHTLMFQTGYLTIASQPSYSVYELKYPNQEVQESFEQFLLSRYVEQHHAGAICYKIAKAFRKNDLEAVEYHFRSLLATIPYDVFEAKQEKYYQAIFYLSLKLIGAYIDVEVKTNLGRIDAVLQNDDTIFIIEFKVNQSAETALQQIIDKKYYEKYQSSPKKIALIGMNCFDKTIQEWLVKWL